MLRRVLLNPCTMILQRMLDRNCMSYLYSLHYLRYKFLFGGITVNSLWFPMCAEFKSVLANWTTRQLTPIIQAHRSGNILTKINRKRLQHPLEITFISLRFIHLNMLLFQDLTFENWVINKQVTSLLRMLSCLIISHIMDSLPLVFNIDR